MRLSLQQQMPGPPPCRLRISHRSQREVIASPATFISFSKPRMFRPQSQPVGPATWTDRSFELPRLSPRGRSHAFDASADGYGRGEGAGQDLVPWCLPCGVCAPEVRWRCVRSRRTVAALVLLGCRQAAPQKALCSLTAASEAALRGTAVNQDGRSSTMTAPNGPSQTMVVATALAEAMLQHHQAERRAGRAGQCAGSKRKQNP